ncbi:MAG TPA: TetR/AcrR family transcriptional regulator [Luteibacter sp.]|uniref:TetR/AcrR family transcriptional regulator n=1 Tax=Luteibacter sp. TaxID=1886636 RepID=UPI002BE2E7B9|nr:TetR/AcrR family transcriptional regulator [Luteibacter sp.]HVI56264.1 TetR/AcrR family transcriptional regulator [Luteibacter sp.]
MGIKERRDRERAAVRERIIDAAEQIAASKDWDAVTIRAVAAAIEYSPALIYEYFKNKDDILLALMSKGFGRLHEALMKVADAAQPPEAVVEGLGLTYWEFALGSPTLYQLMHGLRGVSFGTNQTPPEARACFEDLRAPIERLMAAAGTNGHRDSEEQADLYWAFLHGLVSLSMNQRIKGGPKRASTLVRRLIDDFIQSCIAPRGTAKRRMLHDSPPASAP